MNGPAPRLQPTEGDGGLRERGKARRRQAVLDAARAMMRESETTGFAMRALAQRAGVGEVTPYSLFGSKRGVLEAILAEELETYRAGFDSIATEDELGALIDFIRVNMDIYRGDPQLYRVVLRDLMLTGDPSLRSFFSMPQSRFFVGLVEDAVRAGYVADTVQPYLIARMLGRVITSSIGDWLWEGISLDSLEANIGLGFAMMLRGVATPRAVERCDALIARYQEAVIRHSRRAARSMTAGE